MRKDQGKHGFVELIPVGPERQRHAKLLEFVAYQKPHVLLIGKTARRFRLPNYLCYRDGTTGRVNREEVRPSW